MSDLLSNPAIQSGVIPFIVALAIALFLKRFGWFWSGLAFAIAYYISVYLVAGFQFFPLNSTRKILLLGLLAIAIGLLIDSTRIKPKILFTVTFTLGVLATVWVMWPVLVREEGRLFWLMLMTTPVYTGWLTANANKARHSTAEGAMLALALGLGTGISAILGASALTGQLSIAIGAIAGSFLLLILIKKNIKVGSTFMLPAGLLSGLLGTGAVIYASLPWYCLLPLSATPVVNYIKLPDSLSKFKSLLLLAAITIPFSIIAILTAWITTGGNDSGY